MNKLGAMRLHAGETYIAEVLAGICPHVNSMLFTIDVANESLLALIEKHCTVPYRIECIPCVWESEYSTREMKHSNAKSLDMLLRHVDKERPDVVLTFDEDEIPPVRLGEELRAFEESTHTFMTFWFFHTWGDLDHVWGVYNYTTGPHCKVFKWRPGLSFIPNYRGRCIPTGVAGHRRCPYPLRHTCFTTREMRAERIKERGLSIFERRHLKAPLIPYDPNERWEDFLRRKVDDEAER